jgi:hypothetical protein
VANITVLQTVTLLDSEGEPVPGAVVQNVETELNAGWKASVVILEPFNCDQARYATLTIRLNDDLGGELETPPLVFPQRNENDTRNTEGSGLITLTLEDETSFRMRTPNQSFPSFRATTTGSMVSTLAAAVGVTVEGAPDVYLTEDEAKGVKPDAAVENLRRAFAYETTVETDGTLKFWAWEDPGSTLNVDWSTRNRSQNLAQRFTGVRIGKTSSMPTGTEWIMDFDEPGGFVRPLPVPIMSPAGDGDSSLVGSIGSATFYNADGEIVSHYFWFPEYATPVGVAGPGPATEVGVVVRPGTGFEAEMLVQARLRITGIPYSEEDPPPLGVDPEFLWPPAETSLGEWPYPSNIIEPLYPGLSYGQARHPHILDRLNSASDLLEIGVNHLRCHAGVGLRHRHVVGGRSYKATKIRWDCTGKRTQISLVRCTSDEEE